MMLYSCIYAVWCRASIIACIDEAVWYVSWSPGDTVGGEQAMRTTSVMAERIDEPHVSEFVCILESLKAWRGKEAAMTHVCQPRSVIHSGTGPVPTPGIC